MALSSSGNPVSDRAVLLDSEERLRLIEQNVRDYAIFTLDSNGHIASWNLGGERILLYREEEIIGQSIAIIFTPEDRATGKMDQELATARETGRAEDERWHVRKDGSRFWASGILTALREENGDLRGYAKILRDVSERQQLQEKATHILEAMTDAYFAVDTHGTITYANAHAEALLQDTRENAIGKILWDVFAPPLHSLFPDAVRQAIVARQSATFEIFNSPQNTWLQVRTYPLRDGIAVLFQDISARKHEEEAKNRLVRRSAFAGAVGMALNQSDALQTILQQYAQAMVDYQDAALARIWTLDPATDTLELQASAGLSTHRDGPQSRIRVGESNIGRIAQERTPHLSNMVSPEDHILDLEWARREGIVAFAGYPLLVSDRVVGVIAMFAKSPIAVDVLNDLALVADTVAQTVQRKRTQEELLRSTELLHTTLRSLTEGVITTDAQNRVQYLNPAAEALTGWLQQEALGQVATEIFQLVAEQSEDTVSNPVALTREKDTVRGLLAEFRLIARDGVERTIEQSASPIEDAHGATVGTVLVFRDVTERRKTEAHIQELNTRLQRAMIETHHRVKNNLQLITAMIGLQLSANRESVPIAEWERLEANVRALGIIHDLLTQEAKEGSDQKTLDVKMVLERLFGVVNQTIGSRTLVTTLEEGFIPSRQATSLTLVANELVSNGLKHGNGKVEVKFGVVQGVAILEVSNDGPGFPEGFNPTLAANTGLDLVTNIVDWDLKGEALYTNRAEGGARVTVRFPMPI